MLLSMPVCVCVAVTDQASSEAAAKLMDAKERQREEEREGALAKQETSACTAAMQEQQRGMSGK